MIGTLVSRYRILSRIGEGGMGEVFLAHDPALDRRVALKFLPAAQAGDTTARKRLLNEAQAAARLDHPFVCKVYEVGENAERPFIAMEYVDGTTLVERLRQGPLPRKEAMRLATEIAEAVDFAHTRGIVHRDLKPSNVMIAADGHVKVMDFGVAKYIEARGDDARMTMTATAAGVISGTMVYMSPEQLRGLPVDARSDVFAFGLLLYEMTSGAHPFLRSSPISTVDAILNAAPPPLDEQRPSVPPGLDHIISRCLEKDRDRRYQSLREAQIELERAGRRHGAGRARDAPASPSRDAMGRSRRPPSSSWPAPVPRCGRGRSDSGSRGRRWRSTNATGSSSATSRTSPATRCSIVRCASRSRWGSPSRNMSTCSRRSACRRRCSGCSGRRATGWTKPSRQKWPCAKASGPSCRAASRRSAASTHSPRASSIRNREPPC